MPVEEPTPGSAVRGSGEEVDEEADAWRRLDGCRVAVVSAYVSVPTYGRKGRGQYLANALRMLGGGVSSGGAGRRGLLGAAGQCAVLFSDDAAFLDAVSAPPPPHTSLRSEWRRARERVCRGERGCKGWSLPLRRLPGCVAAAVSETAGAA